MDQRDSKKVWCRRGVPDEECTSPYCSCEEEPARVEKWRDEQRAKESPAQARTLVAERVFGHLKKYIGAENDAALMAEISREIATVMETDLEAKRLLAEIDRLARSE